MVDVIAIGAGLGRLAWVAAEEFAGTLLALVAAGVVLAALSYYFLRAEPVYGAIAAVVAVVEAGAAGVLLGGKRALVVAIVEGLRTMGLGRAAVGAVFDRIVKLTGGAHGERGNALARGLERLPLNQAEAAAREAVDSLIAKPGDGGWLRRTVRTRLVQMAGTYTLARFREEGATHGGIDLVRLRTDLETRVDQTLIDKVRSGMRLWTVLVIVLLPLTVAVQTYLVIAWLRSHG